MIAEHPKIAYLPGLKALWQEAFGDEEAFIDSFFSSGFSPERCLCILKNETVSAAAYWFDCQWGAEKVAYLYAVATAKAQRGQGLCHALLEQLHELLRQQGYAGSLLVPGEPGLERLYGSMGYRYAGGMQEQSYAAGTPLPIRQISPRTFAALRREYLPQGGVAQEGENLSFLSTMARFYAGDDFLLATGNTDGCLQGLELLGNTDAAPGIVAALGFQEGSFRFPGKRPFAMWRSISVGEAPTYFGFAFD